MGPTNAWGSRRLGHLALILTAALILALGLPGLAGAKHKPKHKPSCTSYSTHSIEKTIYSDVKLHLKGTVDSIGCAYLGHKTGHYTMSVGLDIVSGDNSTWNKIKAKAEKVAKQQGATFGVVSTGKLKVIEYAQIQSGEGTGPCAPGTKLPSTGPPSCESEPSWWHQNAWAYGTLAGTNTKLIVATGIYAELGDAGKNGAVDLAKHVLKGKLKHK